MSIYLALTPFFLQDQGACCTALLIVSRVITNINFINMLRMFLFKFNMVIFNFKMSFNFIYINVISSINLIKIVKVGVNLFN